MINAIEIEGLSKIYREESLQVMAVDSVNMSVNRGEVVGILGPSGSGKTTLLSMIGCILRPTEGSIKIYGEETTHMSEKDLPYVRRKHFGFIFQGFNLFPPLSALENVKLPLKIKGMNPKDAEDMAVELLGRVGLKDRGHFLPRYLSGGEKQRVAIARALAGDPEIILADEPTGNLDHKNGRRVVELLRGLVKTNNASAVIVTHDSRIYDLLDRIYFMEDGRIRVQ